MKNFRQSDIDSLSPYDPEDEIKKLKKELDIEEEYGTSLRCEEIKREIERLRR